MAKENSCVLYIKAQFCCLWGLPPKHAYRIQQTEKTVTHAFVSAHVHHSYYSLAFHFPPLYFWAHCYCQGRFQNKQTGIHQLVLSACALCELFCLLENIWASTMWQERPGILELCSLQMLRMSAWYCSLGKLPAIRPVLLPELNTLGMMVVFWAFRVKLWFAHSERIC